LFTVVSLIDDGVGVDVFSV